MAKGKPFLEILASCLHGDYKFPVLELLAFLFLLSSLLFAYSGHEPPGTPEELVVMNLSRSLLGLPLFILVMLLLKNVTTGIGSDLERGTIQTILIYPLRRRSILTAKLFSAVLVAVLLFVGIQVAALWILAPDMVFASPTAVLLTYVSYISPALLIAALTLLLSLILRKTSAAFGVGLMLFFIVTMLVSLVSFASQAMGSVFLWQVYSLICPSEALYFHYASLAPYRSCFWGPALPEVLMYIGASYAVTSFFFVLSYVYFCRRLSV